MRGKNTKNPTKSDDIPDSIDRLVERACFFGNKLNVTDRRIREELKIFELAAKKDERFDLIDRIKDARQRCDEIKRVWHLLMRKDQYDTITYEALRILDPELRKDDYNVMITYYFGALDGRITVESAIQYMKERRKYEHMHVMARQIGKRFDIKPSKIENYLKTARKSSTIRHYFINWGDKKRGTNALFFVSKSRTAMQQINEFIYKKLEKDKKRKVLLEHGVPDGFIHIDDACDYGLTYSELVKAGREDIIENVRKKKGRTTTFFFREQDIQRLIEERKERMAGNSKEESGRKRKTTSFAPKINPPDESMFYCATTLSPREIGNGPITPEEMLRNAHYLTRAQISIYFSLSDNAVDRMIGSGKLKETVIVGTTRYRVANWLITDLKRELDIE